MLRASALMAIVCGLALAIAETAINWGQWQWWPWWLVDFVAAALMIAGGVAVIKDITNGRALLASGWAFALGMGWMSLAGNIAAGPDPERNARVAGLYTDLIASGLVICVIGLAFALFGKAKR
jgi:hypothetical protein